MTPLQHLSKQPKTVADKASDKAHAIDEATQSLIKSIETKDRRLRVWFVVSWTILLLIGIVGIYKQNQIANQNKQHIDCIVKLFVTPTPPNTLHKVIIDPEGQCEIKGQN